MLIAYGVAVHAVVVLSFLHKPAMPFAFALCGGWWLGFLPLEVWWVVSLAQGALLSCYLKHDSPAWPRVVAGCVPLMLLADSVYWLARYNHHDIGPFYENALNVLLTVQLVFTAWPGVRQFAVISRRIGSRLGRIGIVGDPARRPSPARPDGVANAGRSRRNLAIRVEL